MSNQPLIQIVERLERVIAEIKEHQGGLKEIYLEAKNRGYDTKVLRALIKKRASDAQALKEFEETLALYENAMQPLLNIGE